MIMQCKIEHMPIGAKLLAFEVEGEMVKDVQIKPNYIEVDGEVITLMYRSGIGAGRGITSEIGIKAGTMIQYEIEGDGSYSFKFDARVVEALNAGWSIDKVMSEKFKNHSGKLIAGEGF